MKKRKTILLLISLVFLISMPAQPAYGAANSLTAIPGGLVSNHMVEFHEGLCRVHNSTYKDGFMNTDGKLVIPCKYSPDNHLGSFSEGLCPVSLDGRLCYLDKNGNIALKTQFPYATQDDTDFYYEYGADSFKETHGIFLNGRAAVRNDAGRCGFIDKTGREVIACQYDSVENFETGIALVCNNHRYQVIDPAGEKLLKQEYEAVVIEPGGIILASNDTSYDPDAEHSDFSITIVHWYSYDVLDYSGNVLESDVTVDENAGMPNYVKGGYRTEAISHDYANWTTTYAVSDKNGKLLYTTKAFYIIESVDVGIGTVTLSGSWPCKENYIDIATGKPLLPEPADICYPFRDGYGTFVKNDVVYVMNQQGTIFDFPANLTYSSLASDGMIILHDKSKYTSVFLCKLSAVQSVSAPVSNSADPSSSRVLVNGKEIAFEAYTINGSNYFKLRDLAYALNDDEKGFDVTWNSAAKRYFKLRDVMKIFNASVGWDKSTSTITVDTSQGYQE